MNNFNELPAQIFCTKSDKMLSTRILKQKGVEWAGKELSRRRYEKFSRLAYGANCVQISERNLEEIHTLVHDLASMLEITVPDLFLLNSPEIKALVIGEIRPLMLVTSAAVEKLTAQQLKVIITQALMHMYCGHMRCFMLKDLLASTADNTGVFKSVIALPRMLLEEWYVQAQISADRAMLYYIEDLELILDTFSCLITGGVGKQGTKFLLEEYENFKVIHNDTPSCPLFRTWSDLYLTNERYIYRAGKLHEYNESEEYKKICAGGFAAAADTDDSDISEEDACAYWDGLSGRGGAWEAEDVHERLAFGVSDLQSTVEFIKIHAGDMFKFGFDSASKVTSSVLSGIGSILVGLDKKE